MILLLKSEAHTYLVRRDLLSIAQHFKMWTLS